MAGGSFRGLPRAKSRGSRPVAGTLVALVLIGGVSVMAQAQQPPAPAAQPPATPRGRAPIDLTGYWVSIVNEDWRWRMVTPPKGDVASVPLNPEGIKAANAWDPATDGSCLAYGAAGLMRMPTRLNITWQDDRTLKVETDAGQQTRLLRFDGGTAPAQRSLQGHSVAQWEPVPQPGRGGGPPQIPRFGNLKVTTTNLTAGWLRKNGVPYSENATVTEYFDRFKAPNNDEWLVVTTIVSDPKYLNQDFVTSSHFKKEANGAKWSPAPCKPA
jgi:hypothetical protein